MKYLSLIILLFATTAFGQRYTGQKPVVSQTFPLEDFETLEISLTAIIEVDLNAPAQITIETNEDLIPYIGKKVTGGRLELTQIEWIEPRKLPVVKIGAPGLQKLINGAHSQTKVLLGNTVRFDLEANVGRITLVGTADQLNLQTSTAKIDGSALQVKTANVKITGYADVLLDVTEALDSNVRLGKLRLVNGPPAKLSGDTNLFQSSAEKKQPLRFVSLRIKNNSLRRHSFKVQGPNHKGGTFSYGFGLLPQQKKKENWPVGTKVYKVNAFGLERLLIEVTEENRGQTVDLFN